MATGKWRRGLVALASALALVGSAGCTYLAHRGQDALDMIDLGVTASARPGFALYYNFVPVVPIGYGHVDGTFLGIGGGRAGAMPHYERSRGVVLWGEEEVAFGDFDAADPETYNAFRSGIVGLAQGPAPGPDYTLSCPHYIHLGWIGVVASPRYLQMLDFILGWTTLDIGFDDGRRCGRWGGKAALRSEDVV